MRLSGTKKLPTAAKNVHTMPGIVIQNHFLLKKSNHKVIIKNVNPSIVQHIVPTRVYRFVGINSVMYMKPMLILAVARNPIKKYTMIMIMRFLFR